MINYLVDSELNGRDMKHVLENCDEEEIEENKIVTEFKSIFTQSSHDNKDNKWISFEMFRSILKM